MEKVDDFIKLANKLQGGEIKNYVFDEGNSQEAYGLLTHPEISEEYRLKWVLTPRIGNGDFSEMQQYVLCTIANSGCSIGKSGIVTPTPTVKNAGS
jgi:hypothetical protein